MQHEILGRVPLIDSMDGLPHDLAVLDTRIGAVLDARGGWLQYRRRPVGRA